MKARNEKRTKEEDAHLAALKQMPCIINNRDCGNGHEIQHVTDGGRRLGHFYTIPACFNHHQRQSPLPFGEAMDKGARTFAAKYGSSASLVERTRSACPCATCVRWRDEKGFVHVPL